MQSPRVLIVEDEVPIRRLLGQLLGRKNYKVMEAVNGFEALSMCDGPIDVLLTDIVLPGIDGFQLAQAISQWSPATRIVFMSARYDSDAVPEPLRRLNYAFLRKPFAPGAVIHTIETLLQTPASTA